ncbi:unnamed protein product [Vicia faba]|uniref:Uncharacterized protein n=1 Tax=Vicia faba TaxID=3906 RepID=A0AAV1A8X3_VICFA|nr:unnamed protein product [Vicia faba]CAI8604877.1 unnamed protein product [Vicia faba]CAI8608485.1 unnamed protein product [Vicia faba]
MARLSPTGSHGHATGNRICFLTGLVQSGKEGQNCRVPCRKGRNPTLKVVRFPVEKALHNRSKNKNCQGCRHICTRLSSRCNPSKVRRAGESKVRSTSDILKATSYELLTGRKTENRRSCNCSC